MQTIYDEVSHACSKITTNKYSTSFSLGIKALHKKYRDPIYCIYGFVRFADEIVDSFHGFDKQQLLNDFKKDTYAAIEMKLSLNPILHSFQQVVHAYRIRKEWIDCFLESMEMDLEKKEYSEEQYKKYILGSAEVVGLMCLHVFTEGDDREFDRLQPFAMKLGSAFQKINFLRDVKADNEMLGRTYFPKVDLKHFTSQDKLDIEADIAADFKDGLSGIRMLPKTSRRGVYLAYYYYMDLFRKIRNASADSILNQRMRISNSRKLLLMLVAYCRNEINYI
jgi:phytoene/squalene synthetase